MNLKQRFILLFRKGNGGKHSWVSHKWLQTDDDVFIDVEPKATCSAVAICLAGMEHDEGKQQYNWICD